ncbi:MAG: hypothetical protein H7X80_01260 [bacterium]|nr:hypothetical protein [Candidatus Kapabacteria bacterium]
MHPLIRRSISVTTIATLIAVCSVQAQLPSDASAIIARMRAVRAENAKHSVVARLNSTTIVTVHDGPTKLNLVKPQVIVSEGAGSYSYDPSIGSRVRVVATRGTAPLTGLSRGPLENFHTLGELLTIDDDEIVLLNTAIISPLADDADTYYNFVVEGKQQRYGMDVDVIHATPKSTLRPLFQGTLYVARDKQGGQLHGKVGSGALLAMELQPSNTTAIPFVNTLNLKQTFAPTSSGVVVADSLTIDGTATVRVVTFGVAETHVTFSLASRLRDHQVDASMPDSLRMQTSRIVVRDDAMNAASTYWSTNTALANDHIATIDASRAAYVDPTRSFGFSFGGMIDYNRAGGATPTASASVGYGPIAINTSGGYSFGLDRPVGEAALAITFGNPSTLTATARASAFSQIATTSTGDKAYPRIMNTLVAATLHQDYYNFFRKDGWNAGADVGYGKLRLTTTLEQSRHFSIDTNARWSLLTWASKPFLASGETQFNPPITEGGFTTINAELAFSRVAPFLKLTPAGEDDFRWSIAGLRGMHRDNDTTFELVEAQASYSLPIMRTGYNPITITLLGAAGTATATLPPQYQFRLRTSAASFGKPGGFVSPPKGVYGGTEYIALGSEINLTDLWWRAIGLPTINGRGIELIVAGGAARYRQAHHTGFAGTNNLWYSEAGIALSRIPLFLTEIVYGRVDLRKGFGPLGKFGGNFTFVLPL